MSAAKKDVRHFSSSSHQFTITLSQEKTAFSWMDFFQIWHTNKALSGLSSPTIWRCLIEFEGVMNNYIAKNDSKALVVTA